MAVGGAVVGFSIFAMPGSSTAQDPDMRLDSLIQAEMEKERFPGVAVVP